MTIMHASHHTDVSTVNYSSLHTQRKLHHCVTDVKRQYPIAPLFRGDLGMRRLLGTAAEVLLTMNYLAVL